MQISTRVEDGLAEDLPGVCIQCNREPAAHWIGVRLHWTPRLLRLACAVAGGVGIARSGLGAPVIICIGILWPIAIRKVGASFPVCRACRSHRGRYWRLVLGLVIAAIALPLGAIGATRLWRGQHRAAAAAADVAVTRCLEAGGSADRDESLARLERARAEQQRAHLAWRETDWVPDFNIAAGLAGLLGLVLIGMWHVARRGYPVARISSTELVMDLVAPDEFERIAKELEPQGAIRPGAIRSAD